MKLETKRAENYTSLFWSFKIPFVEKTFRFHALLYNTPNSWVHGYSSRTEQGRYVLFHDYDALDLQSIKQELKFLQKKLKLGDYYLFKLDRENSFHAVCLDTFTLSQAYAIQKQTSCDYAFINSIKRLQTREWILRWWVKGTRGAPQFVASLKSPFHKNEQSSAHADFLEGLGVPVIRRGRWDKCKKLALVDYNTSNRIK